jgi:uncharacterized protein
VKAVSDAGPLIHLSWIDRIDLLDALFDEVVVPEAVRDEILRAAPGVHGVGVLRDALRTGRITVQAVVDASSVEAHAADLDPGEAEAIVLMREGHGDIILLDDRRARTRAAGLGLRMTGTIGILQAARGRGLVSAVLPFVAELRQRGFRIAPALLARIEREDSAGGEA